MSGGRPYCRGLMHTPAVLTETVADTVMALMLATARRVMVVAERVKAGEWPWPGVVWRRCPSQNCTRYRWDGAYRDGAGAA